MDNRQANINRFEAEMAKVTRDGVDKLMAFIRKSDMYAAPASTRFHLSVTGGLLQHSLNVLDALRANLTKNDDGTYSYEVAGAPAARVTEENVIIMALLHDICNIIGRKLKCYRVISEKDVPKPLKQKADAFGDTTMVCPNCESAAVINPYRKGRELYPHCPWCGQKLKEAEDETEKENQ